jgi:hypothetical protein
MIVGRVEEWRCFCVMVGDGCCIEERSKSVELCEYCKCKSI